MDTWEKKNPKIHFERKKNTHFGDAFKKHSFNHLVTLQVNNLFLEFCILDLNKGQCFERS